jgi:hypothetical protein
MPNYTIASDPDNTRTPLIAWGKGVRGPLADSIPSSHDAYSSSWGLTNLYRRDVEQADIAPIMASLLGINWPVNSVGVLPDVDPHHPGFLQFSGGEKTRADAALVNARVCFNFSPTHVHKLTMCIHRYSLSTLVVKPVRAIGYDMNP